MYSSQYTGVGFHRLIGTEKRQQIPTNVFWDGIINIDYLQQRRTLHSENYANLLHHLYVKIGSSEWIPQEGLPILPWRFSAGWQRQMIGNLGQKLFRMKFSTALFKQFNTSRIFSSNYNCQWSLDSLLQKRGEGAVKTMIAMSVLLQKKTKFVSSTGKVMATFVWDSNGILSISCFENGKIITEEY